LKFQDLILAAEFVGSEFSPFDGRRCSPQRSTGIAFGIGYDIGNPRERPANLPYLPSDIRTAEGDRTIDADDDSDFDHFVIFYLLLVIGCSGLLVTDCPGFPAFESPLFLLSPTLSNEFSRSPCQRSQTIAH
jgi:hypothetical protein